MTITAIAGFDVAHGKEGPWVGSDAIASVTFVTGSWGGVGYAMRCYQATAGQAYVQLGMQITADGAPQAGGLDTSVMLAFYMGGAYPGANLEIQRGQKATQDGMLHISTTGQVGVQRTGGSVIWSTMTMTMDSWYILSFYDNGSSAAGAITCKIYSSIGGLLETVTTARTAAATGGNHILLGGITSTTFAFRVDAVVMQGDVASDTFVDLGYGAGYRVAALVGTAAGDLLNATLGDPADVAEIPPSTDTLQTRIKVYALGTPGYGSVTTFSWGSISPGAIAGVMAHITHEQDMDDSDSSTNAYLYAKSGATTSHSNAFSSGGANITIASQMRRRLWTSDPNTGIAWTVAGVSALIIGGGHQGDRGVDIGHVSIHVLYNVHVGRQSVIWVL